MPALDNMWTIVFCPTFFDAHQLKSLDERTNGPHEPPSQIAELSTYERVVVHEFFHCDVMGIADHSKRSDCLHAFY